MNIYKKLFGNLDEAERLIKSSRGMVEVAVEILEEPKAMMRVLENLDGAIRLSISSILQYEYVIGKVKLSKKYDENMNRFFRSSVKYGLTKKDKMNMKKLLLISGKHRESGFEFSKNKEVFMMMDDEVYMFVLKECKVFIKTAEKLLKNVKKIAKYPRRKV